MDEARQRIPAGRRAAGIEQQKLADGSWVPKSIEARAQARTFLFFNHNFQEAITYGDYRRSGTTMAEGRRR